LGGVSGFYVAKMAIHGENPSTKQALDIREINSFPSQFEEAGVVSSRRVRMDLFFAPLSTNHPNSPISPSRRPQFLTLVYDKTRDFVSSSTLHHTPAGC